MALVKPKEEDGGPPTLLKKNMFSLRIVHLDYYMTAPLAGMDDCYSHFQGCSVREVPVVRIFGSTISAQKTCLHLHKAFPYFYVAYDDDLPQEVNEALACVRRLASAVERALKVASTVGAKRQHVHSCSLVRGTKYYGYHPTEQLFVKIVLYYPQEVSRTSTLLLSGGIMNHKFQPYEGHIPYLLQILIDYNLYGMGHLHLSNLKFRNPLPAAPFNLSSLVDNVKSEYLFKQIKSEIGNQNPDSSSSHMGPLTEIDNENNKAHSVLHLSTQQRTDQMQSVCTVPKPIPSGSHDSTPVTGSQPDLWIQGRVPGAWIWPVLDPSQGHAPYSRQSICELEADASVEDILNRGELLFKPLQQTGPEVKMVQSLTQMWEEELLRTGEDGPAGPVNADYQPTARTAPSASALEQAMREALTRIANSEDHRLRPTSNVQDCSPSSDLAGASKETAESLSMLHDKQTAELLANQSSISVIEDRVLGEQKSFSLAQSEARSFGVGESLLRCTGVANRENPPVSTSVPILRTIIEMPSDEDDIPQQADVEDNKEKSTFNEEAIKSHLSQRLRSQVQDSDVAEFLQWMGATQPVEDRIDDDKVDEMTLTQMFSSPGMDAALLQALADYENATERECQAILDCEEEDGNEQDPTSAHVADEIKGGDDFNNLLKASTSNTKQQYDHDTPLRIPQYDGAFDDEDLEDDVDHDEQPRKKSRVEKAGKSGWQHRLGGESRDNVHKSSREGSKEPSLRELMRRQRERRPRKKSSSASLSEDTIIKLESHNLQNSDTSISNSDEIHRTGRKTRSGMLKDHEEQVLDRVDSQQTSDTSRLDRATSGNPDLTRMGRGGARPYDKNLVKSSKYAPLPVVKVKIESGAHSPTMDLLERDRKALSNTEQASSSMVYKPVIEIGPAHIFKKDDIGIKTQEKVDTGSSGDDRDCGGGPCPAQELGKQRVSESSRGSLDLNFTPATCHIRKANDMNIGDKILKDGEGLGKEIEHCEQAQENQCTISQDIRQVSSHGKNNMEPQLESESLLSDTQICEGTENESEMNVECPVNELTGEGAMSVLGMSAGAEQEAEGLGGLANEVLYTTQYHFSDMSDDSQDSFDSAMEDNPKEQKWNAAEAFFDDEGNEELQSLHMQEQNDPPRDSTADVPDEVGIDFESPKNPISVHLMQDELGVLIGPSSSVCPSIVGEPAYGRSQDRLVNRGSPASPSTLKSSSAVALEVSPEPLKPFFPSRSFCEDGLMHNKQNTQPVNSFVSLLPERRAGNLEVLKSKSSLHAGFHDSDGSTHRYGLETNMVSDEGVTTDQNTLLAACAQLTGAPGDLLKNEEGEKLFPLIFHQRPPVKEELLLSYREVASSFNDEGGVFYGNIRDVSDRPAIMAGLIFDVKSREACHLRPFAFGGSSRRSNFEAGAKIRKYVEQENWGAEGELDAVIGVSSHFENDGTVSYLMSPAKPPPSSLVVKQWVSSLQSVGNVKITDGGGNQMFTMDANTGKLVPLAGIGSGNNSQNSVETQTQGSLEDDVCERPASPKYDETHIFNLTGTSSGPATWKTPEKKADGLKSGGYLSKEPSSTAAPHQGFSEAFSKPLLVPCNAQAILQQKSSVADVTKDEELKTKVKIEAPGNDASKDEKNKPTSGKPFLKSQWRDISQITGISPGTHLTPLSQAGFHDPASVGGGQQITLMSIEVFASTRDEFLPDPRYDAIGCIVLVIHEDGGRTENLTVVLIRDMDAHTSGRYVDGLVNCKIIYLPDEAELFKCFVQLVQKCDPDMLLGWEVQGYSLGLLAERAANIGIGLLKQLSRIPAVGTSVSEVVENDPRLEEVADLFDKLPTETKGGDQPIIEDEWGRTHGSGLYVGGRIILNLWRIMRGEVKLGIYSLEAVAEAVLRRRVPRIPWKTLTRWFSLGPGGGRFRCLEYFIDRAQLNLQIVHQLDLMNRTAELARVFGIDFYSVFSRGSQFRVESMMARLAHTQNYVLVSPTRQQVADQPAMECLPLVMEPESRFYTSPVIVLDFQSLYPSMIIAYNLCFSTCLGKLVPDNPKILGVSKLSIPLNLLESLKECMTITPNGVMFIPKEVRPGVLPRLLQEILTTRIMVKKAMKKLSPDQRVLQRVLNARQFALKLIANVTYGYTAAGFSGRMPCAEIADSIVQCGRLTLERAIKMVNSHPTWGGRVVYGDTDSMFVLLEGRSREEAHAIGQEIAAAVTETNPPPVALKMEKVYHPCVLLTKKRYVGYSYESASQVKPTFDAKGIETIRRDSCPAVAKALEHSLKILFDSKDLSQVKQYLQRQWGKIQSGRISLQDFIFAKEVRLGTYSNRSPVLPPAAIVASKAMARDPRAEPRYGERVSYVVVHGEPGARLVDMVVDPLTLVDQPSLRLHDTYYITKQIIPACQRIFMLVGVDLKSWFGEMPRVYRPPVSKRVSSLAVGARSTTWDPEAAKRRKEGGMGLKHGTIDQYYLSRHCTVCGEFTRASQLLCGSCSQDNHATAPILIPARTARLEREFRHLEAICRHCGGGDGGIAGSIACLSLDCSVFFERRKVHRELQAAGAVARDLGYYPPCLRELF